MFFEQKNSAKFFHIKITKKNLSFLQHKMVPVQVSVDSKSRHILN